MTDTLFALVNTSGVKTIVKEKENDHFCNAPVANLKFQSKRFHFH